MAAAGPSGAASRRQHIHHDRHQTSSRRPPCCGRRRPPECMPSTAHLRAGRAPGGSARCTGRLTGLADDLTEAAAAFMRRPEQASHAAQMVQSAQTEKVCRKQPVKAARGPCERPSEYRQPARLLQFHAAGLAPALGRVLHTSGPEANLGASPGRFRPRRAADQFGLMTARMGLGSCLHF